MKKRGFTLIELLAVIVILAIIALIATPIIMNTINNSKKSAAERSGERYVKAVETMIATERLDNEIIADGTYSINSSGNLVVNGVEKTIDMSGTKPSNGSITIKDGLVEKDSISIKLGDYMVTYNSEGKIEAGDPFALGTKYSIDPGNGMGELITFYVLEVTTDDVVLIADKNIGPTTVWCEDVDFECDPETGIFQSLIVGTGNWANEKIKDIDVPTYQQLYNINNSSDLSNSPWLLTNLQTQVDYTFDDYLPYGYWTATPDGYYAFFVFYDDKAISSQATYYGDLGIRPVITISKEDL